VEAKLGCLLTAPDAKRSSSSWKSVPASPETRSFMSRFRKRPTDTYTNATAIHGRQSRVFVFTSARPPRGRCTAAIPKPRSHIQSPTRRTSITFVSRKLFSGTTSKSKRASDYDKIQSTPPHFPTARDTNRNKPDNMTTASQRASSARTVAQFVWRFQSQDDIIRSAPSCWMIARHVDRKTGARTADLT